MQHIVLRRGDIAFAHACAIVTSANDSLVGNASPRYWRFAKFVEQTGSNADESVRRRAGPELAAACLALPCVPRDSTPRDLQQWESTAKVGASKFIRCRVGQCVVTPSFGDLDCAHVVHAVAPDALDAYDRAYWLNHKPLALLREAYRCSLSAAVTEARATKISVAGLGCGVKGWPPQVAAAVALDASAEELMSPMPTRLQTIECVVNLRRRASRRRRNKENRSCRWQRGGWRRDRVLKMATDRCVGFSRSIAARAVEVPVPITNTVGAGLRRRVPRLQTQVRARPVRHGLARLDLRRARAARAGVELHVVAGGAADLGVRPVVRRQQPLRRNAVLLASCSHH